MKFGSKINSYCLANKSIKYNYLKSLIKNNNIEDFLTLLKKDIDNVSTHFKYLEKNIFNNEDKQELYKFGVINIIAIEKIIKKYNRWINPKINKDIIYNFVVNTYFYNKLNNIESNTKLTNIASSNECGICFSKGIFQLNLNCGHSLCIDCINKLNNYSHKNCPFCRKENIFNPKQIQSENFLNKKINDKYSLLLEGENNILHKYALLHKGNNMKSFNKFYVYSSLFMVIYLGLTCQTFLNPR